jgi:trimethylguanosine synthase
MDNSETRLKIARHNAHVYGVADRIEFVLADFVSFARQDVFSSPHLLSPIDVVFLSPPWGGLGYLSGGSEDEEGIRGYRLRSTLPIPGDELWRLARRISPHVAFYLPRNVSLQDVGSLLKHDAPRLREGEKVEVEEEWMGTKLKALTCYFGGLAFGQEYMFEESGVEE